MMAPLEDYHPRSLGPSPLLCSRTIDAYHINDAATPRLVYNFTSIPDAGCHPTESGTMTVSIVV